MSKGLRNMSKDERKAAIARRLNNTLKGLGYYAALDAQKREAEKAAQQSAQQN